MKRFALIIGEILTVASLAGAYAVQYFTDRKLGMVRWLNHRYGKLTDAVPYDVLKYVIAAVVVAVALFLLWRLWHRRNALGKAGVFAALFATSVIVLFAVTTCLVTHEHTKADFLLFALNGIAALVQLVILAIAAQWDSGVRPRVPK